MNDVLRLCAASAVALFLAPAVPDEAGAVTVSLSCGAVGSELKVCQEGAEIWAKKTGNTVNIVSTPNSSSERLALYQQILAAGGTDIDVYQIDVVWPGILAQHFIDLTPAFGGETGKHFEAIVENNTIGGELKAMPWFTDAGLLYYRKDLLEKYNVQPPKTWQELTVAAKTVMDGERAAGNGGMWGLVFQGRAYEGLTCDALEWIYSSGGGTIVDDAGEITINNPQAAAALTLAASWMNTITPTGVLNYAEEEARGVFQSGNAVFMRNWPYAWSLSQSADSAVKDKVGVSALPHGEGGESTGALGGWQLAVSKYSQNQDAAIDLVRYLTSAEEQKRRAVTGSFNPTIAELYKDPEILAAAPFMGELYDTFVNAVARPSSVTGQNYNRVSNEFWNAVHDVLSGSGDAEGALADLESNLKRVKRRGW